jgi:hypothetical protein
VFSRAAQQVQYDINDQSKGFHVAQQVDYFRLGIAKRTCACRKEVFELLQNIPDSGCAVDFDLEPMRYDVYDGPNDSMDTFLLIFVDIIHWIHPPSAFATPGRWQLRNDFQAVHE